MLRRLLGLHCRVAGSVDHARGRGRLDHGGQQLQAVRRHLDLRSINIPIHQRPIGRVQPQAPAQLRLWQLKGVHIRRGIGQQQAHFRARLVQTQRTAHAQQATFGVLPVFGPHDIAVLVEPLDVTHLRQRLEQTMLEVAAAQGAVIATQLQQPRQEQLLLDSRGRLRLRPVEPAELGVLAVRVVVALLAVAEFVPAQQHRCAVGEQQRRQHRALDACSQRRDGCIIGRPFDAAVLAGIVVAAVAILLAIGFVVLLVVADPILQCKAIVRGDEIQRCPGSAPMVIKQIR